MVRVDTTPKFGSSHEKFDVWPRPNNSNNASDRNSPTMSEVRN